MDWGQGPTAPGRGQAGSLDESSDLASVSSHGEELPWGGSPLCSQPFMVLSDRKRRSRDLEALGLALWIPGMDVASTDTILEGVRVKVTSQMDYAQETPPELDAFLNTFITTLLPGCIKQE